ncbi:MAG: M15 family metallopeptidase [Clostridia bacterium]|nr:M15 family metallopeptidase [Clostridia bacterium]
MEGLSMRSNPDITYDDLSYLSVPHYDFSGNTTVGHMVVNRDVAEEVLDIFAELYDIGYPIERMELIDKYGADDYVSIDNNNTSAFNYRLATDGSGRLSKHAMGMAVDINPQINPYVYSSGVGSHENAREYWSRDYNSWQSETAKAAFIGYDTQIYKIFVEEHGWEWGGAWSGYRDYQHFQKTF